MVKEDKSFYDKKIIYLDYFERGEKVKNGGFLKWEAKGDDSRLQIHIRGLYPTDTLQGEIQIISMGEIYPADRVTLHFGTGEYAAVWKNAGLAGTEITYAECDGIQIRLSENRTLKGIWREREKKAEAMPVYESSPEEVQELTIREVLPEEALTQVTEEAQPEKALTQVTEKTQPEEAPRSLHKQETEKSPTDRHAGQEMLSGDKWEQLSRHYPRISPFGDNREYLSITPRDFIILARQYQNLVQNSFLLHGYYNYGHVVLTKIVEKEEECFYLGVPGVYYDREKQAALMFGFEGFEAGTDRISDGGFGYYMKRVDI
ncbi:MAG: DUF6128 domain-containing protein [Lachnospiraceae bacterium]